MTRIACIGECMVELVERPDGFLSRGFGGDTLNTAIYLARLGMRVDYVTALGRDPFSDDMVRAWEGEGIGTELVLRCEGALPGLYLIQTDENGERRFSYWRDSAPVRRLLALPEMERVEAALLAHRILYLSGITLSLFDPPSRARLFRILDDHRARGGTVAFDTNFRPRGWPDRAVARQCFVAVIERADLVLAGVEDWCQLTGTTDERSAVDDLAGLEIPELVLKHGGDGCRIRDGNDWFHVAARRVDAVVDTTAAGDSFAAAYIAARATGDAPPVAAARGHALAAVVIGHRGALIPRHLTPPLHQE